MLKDVYFLNSQGLSEELKSGTFSELRALKHLIVLSVLGVFTFEFPVVIEFSETEISLWKNLGSLLMMIIEGVITYYGVWLTYQANEKGDGKDFFLRFISLSLPVGFKLALYFLLTGLGLAAISALLITGLGSFGVVVSMLIMFLATTAFYGLFFVQLRNHIARVSGYESQ
ncbi:hypothetical protein SAMN03080615_02867 [Amphritea atlantica]|uniref:Uncharacterized protein n=1 Tax=Amphritea atlantica TaxID=355243 RepID=A0A1H9J4H2_9GAMM|nr:hypothetical protein [Amphritea atlantica]SEQ81688.1 hypothetical protein SAMN03080615_02867 [Amphritea atlantica]